MPSKDELPSQKNNDIHNVEEKKLYVTEETFDGKINQINNKSFTSNKKRLSINEDLSVENYDQS